MKDLLDNFSETMDIAIKNKFPWNITKVCKMNRSFYVLIRMSWGKIFDEACKNMYENIKSLSEKIYNEFSEKSKQFKYNSFPYFKSVRCYRIFHYHFLVVRKDYQS